MDQNFEIINFPDDIPIAPGLLTGFFFGSSLLPQATSPAATMTGNAKAGAGCSQIEVARPSGTVYLACRYYE